MVIAAELKTPAEVVGSVSQKATMAKAELKETDKRENVKQNETEPALELKKSVEEIASVMQKAAEETSTCIFIQLEAVSCFV